MSNGQKLHYYLVAGIVAFQSGEEVGSINLNAVVTNTKKEFPVRCIAKAQQALQMNFFKRMPDEEVGKVNVMDVVLTAVCHLGHFSEESFHETPEGTQLAEMTEDSTQAEGDNKEVLTNGQTHPAFEA